MFGPHSKPISAVPTWFKADFRRFNPFRLFWSPIDMTWFGQYGLILAEWARFDVNRSRVNANWAKSTRIREKIIIKKNKKKLRHGTDSRAATSDAAPRDELRRTLVRHPPSRNCASELSLSFCLELPHLVNFLFVSCFFLFSYWIVIQLPV